MDAAVLRRRTRVTAVALVAAALMVVGALAPWVTALGVSASGLHRRSGWIVIGAAALGAVLLWLTRANRGAGLFPLAGGAAAAAVALRERNHIAIALHGAGVIPHSSVGIGWGLELVLAASVAFAVAGAVWLAIVPSEDRADAVVPAEDPE